jgi:uncharacterized membrane protein YdcZ (DUF606 family)
MSEGSDQMPKRYKTGLDIPPHKVEQLRRGARRIPWLVVGTVGGAFFMTSWPGQTKEAALLNMAICVGVGLIVGLILDRLSRHWFLPETRD